MMLAAMVAIKGDVDVQAHPAKDPSVVQSWTTTLQAVVLGDRHEEEGGRGAGGEEPVEGQEISNNKQPQSGALLSRQEVRSCSPGQEWAETRACLLLTR